MTKKHSKEDYLIICLAEECAEVAQRCSKMLRFGKDNVQEGQFLTNAERLIYEYNDLRAVVEMLEELKTIELDEETCRLQIEAKKAKINSFYAESTDSENTESYEGYYCISMDGEELGKCLKEVTSPSGKKQLWFRDRDMELHWVDKDCVERVILSLV
jgi:hypothetical protein